MSTKNNTIVENIDFVNRLVIVCGTNEPAELSRLLKISYQGAKNYLEGRFPDAKVLLTIVEETGCSLNWLLCGIGDMYLIPKPVSFDEMLNERIEKIVNEILKRQRGTLTLPIEIKDIQPKKKTA